MIIVDTETTGIDPSKNALASIGAIEFVNPKNTFYVEIRMDDKSEIDPESLKITGFSEKELRDPNKPQLKDALRSFASWFSDCTSHILTGHNIWFDKAFLDEGFKKINLGVPYAKRTIDLHPLAFMHFLHDTHEIPMSNGHSKLDSDHIFKYVGITETRGKHNALEDAKLTAEAVSRILYNQQLIDEYRKFPIPWK